MRASLLAVAAAAVMVAGVPSAPGFAQGVSVDVPGVGVRIGDRDRRHRDREVYREHRRDRVTVGGAGCRTVTVKERLPNGTTVIRKKSSC